MHTIQKHLENDRYYGELHTYRKDFGDWVLTGVVVTVLVLAASAIAIGVWDGAGRKDYNHPGPVPAKVVQISKDQYLIADGGPQVSEVCGGAIDSTAKIGKINSTFVDCYEDDKITWNDHRARSLNYIGAADHFIHSIYVDVLLFLAAFGAWGGLAGHVLRWYRIAGRNMRANEVEAIDYEKARLLAAAEQDTRFNRLKRELEDAWTRLDDPISDEAYERKLGDLIAKRDKGEL